ncbi:MAG: protein-glutamate O-methyltransferase CheR [bacterium]|nr:protein-glutamate O-methyltransferase CheR [bacterium]
MVGGDQDHGALLRIRELVQAYAGMRVEETKMISLRPRFLQIVAEMGCHTLTGLADKLLQEMAFATGPAWRAVLPLVTINETYFFREMHQLEIFRTGLLPLIARRNAGSKSIKVLSAPCSNGSEPYTIAMLLERSPIPLIGWKVSIHGVDIDPGVVEQAKKGLFTRSSFRATDETVVDRYFRKEGDQFRIIDRIRDVVKFRQGNLLEMDQWSDYSGFDVIFCRNLLIYFDQATQRKLVALMYKSLNPGGYLLLGHSESLLTLGSEFVPDPSFKTLVYYKPQVDAPSRSVL